MDKVRIGVLGLGRGTFAMNYCEKANNAVVTAICDFNIHKLDAKKREGIACFTDFDEFIKYENMDAVVLANYGTEHAPFAVKALKIGKHVLSEVLPFQNLKEGVELVEAVEESGLVYGFAENYAYMPCNREMRKMVKDGRIGKFEYGEGEYLHNCEDGWRARTGYNPDNWRNHMPSTFYCTHSIGPMIHIAGQRPVKVTGFELPYNERMRRMGAKASPVAIEMITLESGAIIKSIHGVGVSKNSYWFSMYGSKGRAESAREATGEHVNYKKLLVNIDEYEGQNILDAEMRYYPHDEFTNVSRDFGHGGGDYLTMYHFCEAVLGRENDMIDIYEACDMFLPGLFAYRSILAGGIPMDIPDFRKKEDRDKYRFDTACTDKNVAGNMLQPSYHEGNPDIPEEVYKKPE